MFVFKRAFLIIFVIFSQLCPSLETDLFCYGWASVIWKSVYECLHGTPATDFEELIDRMAKDMVLGICRTKTENFDQWQDLHYYGFSVNRRLVKRWKIVTKSKNVISVSGLISYDAAKDEMDLSLSVFLSCLSEKSKLLCEGDACIVGPGINHGDHKRGRIFDFEMGKITENTADFASKFSKICDRKYSELCREPMTFSKITLESSGFVGLEKNRDGKMDICVRSLPESTT